MDFIAVFEKTEFKKKNIKTNRILSKAAIKIHVKRKNIWPKIHTFGR
jgi:hypothetical protein